MELVLVNSQSKRRSRLVRILRVIVRRALRKENVARVARGYEAIATGRF